MVSPGIRHLLHQSVKWIGVPLALLGVGYFLVGPYVLPRIAGVFMKQKVLQPSKDPNAKSGAQATESTPPKRQT